MLYTFGCPPVQPALFTSAGCDQEMMGFAAEHRLLLSFANNRSAITIKCPGRRRQKRAGNQLQYQMVDAPNPSNIKNAFREPTALSAKKPDDGR